LSNSQPSPPLLPLSFHCVANPDDPPEKTCRLSKKVEDGVEIHVRPPKPHLSMLGHFPIVTAFIEGLVRILVQRSDRLRSLRWVSAFVSTFNVRLTSNDSAGSIANWFQCLSGPSHHLCPSSARWRHTLRTQRPPSTGSWFPGLGMWVHLGSHHQRPSVCSQFTAHPLLLALDTTPPVPLQQPPWQSVGFQDQGPDI